MHVILSYSSNKLKSCVKSKMTFYNKFLAQAYTSVRTNGLVGSSTPAYKQTKINGHGDSHYI